MISFSLALYSKVSWGLLPLVTVVLITANIFNSSLALVLYVDCLIECSYNLVTFLQMRKPGPREVEKPDG